MIGSKGFAIEHTVDCICWFYKVTFFIIALCALLPHFILTSPKCLWRHRQNTRKLSVLRTGHGRVIERRKRKKRKKKKERKKKGGGVGGGGGEGGEKERKKEVKFHEKRCGQLGLFLTHNS